MFSERRISGIRAFRLAGAALLLLGLAAFLLCRQHQPSTADTRPSIVREPLVTSPLTASNRVLLEAAANNPASSLGPGVAELAQRISQWQQLHPNFQLVVETTGHDLAVTTEVFRFTSGQGSVVHRVKTEMRAPLAFTLVTESGAGVIRAYFPEANQVVEIDREEELGRLPGQAAWLGSGLDATAMLRLVRASFVEAGPDYQALTLMFPGAVFGIPLGGGDLFLTLRVDEQGKVLAVEQLTLGMKVESQLTYVEEDKARVEERSPKIPGTAVLVKKTFQEVLEAQVAPKKTGTAKRTTI